VLALLYLVLVLALLYLVLVLALHMSPFKDALPKMQMIEDRLAGKA